jgi:hypothetical protein
MEFYPMAYTDKCDVYCALHEKVINRLIVQAMRCFPSFFNFGSPFVCTHPKLWCSAINADSSVTASGDPLMTSVPVSLPSDLNLPMNITPVVPDFCAQVTSAEIDFYPGNVIALPPSFPAILSQLFGMKVTVQTGLACPNCTKEAEILNKFSLDIFGEMALRQPSSTQWLDPSLIGFDIQGIGPDGLKAFIDCYGIFIANQALKYIGSLVSGLAAAPQSLPNLYGTVSLSVSPSAIANNPAIEDDQVKLFTDLSKFKINEVIGLSGSNTPGSELAPAVSHSPRPRPSSGPADVTAAISQSVFARIFGAMLNGGMKFDTGLGLIGNTSDFFYLNYEVSASLQSGTINLQNNGTVALKDLVISWDTLKFTVNINLPTIGPIDLGPLGKIGPFFGDNPDISIPIDLSGDFTTKVSATALPVVLYGQGDPNTPKCPNRWQLFIVPQLPLFIMPLEFNDKFKKQILDGIKKAFSDIGIPDWATGPVMDALNAIDGVFSSFDSIAESFIDIVVNGVGSNIGLTQKLDTMLYDYFANSAPLFELPDPYLVSLADKNTHRPANNLSVPISYLGATINAKEMVIEGDIGL